MATRPCYTFHSSYSYLYYRILSCYMLSSCTFHILSSCTIRILHIHLYVLILSYTLCFRILSVFFLCWLKSNTFISYLYFSYYVNFYLIFHISRRSTRLILLLSDHILSYVFTYAFMYAHIRYCHIIYFHLILFIYYFLFHACTCSYTFHVLYFVLSIYCIHINFSDHFTFLYIFIYHVGSYNLMLQNLSSHNSVMLLRSYHIFSHVIFKSFVLCFMPA